MTTRAKPALFVLFLAGCGFDFGDQSRPHESIVVDPITVELPDGGTSIVTTQQCVFVPCNDPYGTSCGWVCPSSNTQ